MTPAEARKHLSLFVAQQLRAELAGVDDGADVQVDEDRYLDSAERVVYREETRRFMVEMYAAAGEPACSQCGCTQEAGCEEGCSWTEDDLCSACAPPPAPKKRRSRG